jgi:hypothetical protein
MDVVVVVVALVVEAVETVADENDDEEAEEALDEVDESKEELSVYTDRRLPAPHSSYPLPMHGKLQSAAGAGCDPAFKTFPQ